MGIFGLLAELKINAPGAITSVTIDSLAGETIAIDTSIFVYQWATVARNIVNSRGEPINHLQGAFFLTLRLLRASIRPIYVFDGQPGAAKADTIAARKMTGPRVSREIFADVKRLLELMNVDIVSAVGEADPVAAAIPAYAVATEDMDAMAFGARRVLRGLKTTAKNVQIIDTEKALELLEMTRPQFVDYCILLGCDYTGTIRGIGPKKALALIKKYISIEEIIYASVAEPGPDFNYEAARREFQQAAAVEGGVGEIADGVGGIGRIADGQLPDQYIEKLRAFLVDEKGLSANRITKGLDELKKLKYI